MAKSSDRPIDAEGICTRIAARLIEQLGAVEIAPDSPQWEDLTQGGHPVGQLRVYRGRGSVQKVVASRFRLSTPAMESHSLVVFTQPECPVPHLVIDAVCFGPQASFHVDLLPKRDLAVSLGYLDACFAPLSAIRAELDQDTRFCAGATPLRQRALLSPWTALYTHAPDLAQVALGYVERYFEHWASLLRSKCPELSPDAQLTERDALHRRLLFSREVDPLWSLLDRALGGSAVDRLLSVLAS